MVYKRLGKLLRTLDSTDARLSFLIQHQTFGACAPTGTFLTWQRIHTNIAITVWPAVLSLGYKYRKFLRYSVENETFKLNYYVVNLTSDEHTYSKNFWHSWKFTTKILAIGPDLVIFALLFHGARFLWPTISILVAYEALIAHALSHANFRAHLLK